MRGLHPALTHRSPHRMGRWGRIEVTTKGASDYTTNAAGWSTNRQKKGPRRGGLRFKGFYSCLATIQERRRSCLRRMRGSTTDRLSRRPPRLRLSLIRTYKGRIRAIQYQGLAVKRLAAPICRGSCTRARKMNSPDDLGETVPKIVPSGGLWAFVSVAESE
jgi:hypothetical protein